MFRKVFAAVLLAGMVSGCSMSEDTAKAEPGVQAFHQQLDAGRFVQIYDDASDDLKQASQKEDFVALLEAVHRKLGNTRSSAKQGWKVDYHTSGTFVTLQYHTVYEEGAADETFVFRLQGDAVSLAGYFVNSNALILK